MNDLEGYPSRSLVTATFFQLLVIILLFFDDFKAFLHFSYFLLPCFFFLKKTPALVHRNGSQKDCQEPQEEVLRIVRFGSTRTTEPQKTSQDPLGRAQELPNSPQGSPRSTPGTPEDHPRPPRHRSRAPKEPPWTPRTTGKSLFLPSFLLPPSSLFLPPFLLLPPPSFLPSLCKFLPTTSGQPVCAPTLGIPTGGRRHRAPALKIRRPNGRSVNHWT